MGFYRNCLTNKQIKDQRKVLVFKKNPYFDHDCYHDVRTDLIFVDKKNNFWLQLPKILR